MDGPNTSANSGPKRNSGSECQAKNNLFLLPQEKVGNGMTPMLGCTVCVFRAGWAGCQKNHLDGPPFPFGCLLEGRVEAHRLHRDAPPSNEPAHGAHGAEAAHGGL